MAAICCGRVKTTWKYGTLRSSIVGAQAARRASRTGILGTAVPCRLRTIAADPKHLGAELGFFAVLHTWGRRCFIVPTCIASSLVAVFLATAAVGSPHIQ
jgi:hypothetical protein